jgi:hypothetical protein
MDDIRCKSIEDFMTFPGLLSRLCPSPSAPARPAGIASARDTKSVCFRRQSSIRANDGRAYHRSVLGRFHQAPAGISQANGIAVFNNYPASRDCKLDCVRGLPVDLSRHAPVQGRLSRRTGHTTCEGQRSRSRSPYQKCGRPIAEMLGRQTAQARRLTPLSNFRAA